MDKIVPGNRGCFVELRGRRRREERRVFLIVGVRRRRFVRGMKDRVVWKRRRQEKIRNWSRMAMRWRLISQKVYLRRTEGDTRDMDS